MSSLPAPAPVPAWVTAAPSPWQRNLAVLMLGCAVVMAPGGTLNFSSRNAKIERCLNCYYVLFGGWTCASKREEKNTGGKKADRMWRITLKPFSHAKTITPFTVMILLWYCCDCCKLSERCLIKLMVSIILLFARNIIIEYNQTSGFISIYVLCQDH